MAWGARGTRSSSITSRQPERRATWEASRASPSERSISAWACAARRRPSSSRSGGRAWRCSRKAAPAGAERARHDEQVARAGAAAAGNARRAAQRGDGEVEALGGRRVAAEHRHAGLVQAFVELEHVLEPRLGRCAEADDQPLGLGARGGEIAEVDRRGAVAQLAVARPGEPEVHLLDERVLRDDEAAFELGGVVLDPAREAPALELVQQAELAELREPHRSPPAPPPRPSPPARPRPRRLLP